MGLVANEFEKAGMSTVTLSNIPILTEIAGAPRTAAIEQPFGRTVGNPHDSLRQNAVLEATLKALENIREPGTTVHLPFKWEAPQDGRTYVKSRPPPIVSYLARHPWALPKFLNRTPPE